MLILQCESQQSDHSLRANQNPRGVLVLKKRRVKYSNRAPKQHSHRLNNSFQSNFRSQRHRKELERAELSSHLLLLS